MSDPRTTGDMPRSGTVQLFHASEATASHLREAGLTPGSDGAIWLASSPEIADLQSSAGTRSRTIKAIVEVAVDPGLLEYERTNGDVHIFALLTGDPFTVTAVDDWPASSTTSFSSESPSDQTTPPGSADIGDQSDQPAVDGGSGAVAQQPPQP
jgi:hypothetical protein